MKRYLLLSVLALLAGCEPVHLHGSDVPESQLAELTVSNLIFVKGFDGKMSSHKMSGGNLQLPSTTYRITAGHHTLVACYSGLGGSDTLSSDFVRIEFDALPGKKYELKYSTRRTQPNLVSAGDRETITEVKMWVEEVH